MEKILTSIYSFLENNPGRPKIYHIQANIPSPRSRIADLTEKIEVGFLAFDSHTPPSPAQKKTDKPPSYLTYPRTRRGRAYKRKIYLSPDDTSNLYGGIIEGLNGGKLFHNPSCMATKHPTSITGSLPPFHNYLTLPGSFIIHPSPLFFYKYFSLDTIKKLKLTTITPQESATVRCMINTCPLNIK